MHLKVALQLPNSYFFSVTLIQFDEYYFILYLGHHSTLFKPPKHRFTGGGRNPSTGHRIGACATWNTRLSREERETCRQ